MLKEQRNLQYYKFCMYGFFKNLRFFEPFFMLFFLEKGISFINIGFLYAIREILIIILELPTGILADLLGRKKTMIASFMGYIVSFSLFYVASDFFWLIAGMLAFSFGDAMRTGTHKAMIFDYLKINNWQHYKVNYYGHTRSWSQIGSAISSLIAALIVIFTGNYQQIFLFSIIPYLLDLLIIASYPKQLDGPLKKNINSFKERIHSFKNQITQTVKNKNNWNTFLNLSVYQGLFKSSKDYLQPMIIISLNGMLLISESPKLASLVIGVVYFTIYLFSSLISRHSATIAKPFKNLYQALNFSLLAGFIVFILSGALTYFEFNNLSILVFIIIFTIQNFRKPIGAALVAEKVNADILATGLSLQSLFDALFTSIIAIAIGFLADRYSIEKAFVIIGLGFLFSYPLLKLKRPTNSLE